MENLKKLNFTKKLFAFLLGLFCFLGTGLFPSYRKPEDKDYEYYKAGKLGAWTIIIILILLTFFSFFN